MITDVMTTANLKQLFEELFLNKTDKVSDISDNSVVNAVAFGVAKVGQKALKDIAIVEAHIFPDDAYGTYLDEAALLYGTPARFGAVGSSTYLRLVANPGTIYLANSVRFSSYTGIQFVLTSDITIGTLGYAYAKVTSVTTGSNTNVDPNTIINIINAPTGHLAVTNEYSAVGGIDTEDDDTFRERIKQHDNVLARDTIAYFTQIFQIANNDVMKVINLGNNDAGHRVLGIVLVNGADLSSTELNDLLNNVKSYFSISDINLFGDTIGIELQNTEWATVDVDFRVQILSNYDVNTVRKQIQVNLTKLLDFRYWIAGQKIAWVDLFDAVKNTEGVQYVPDNYFSPSVDLAVPLNQLPRIRGFIMRDLDGNVIADANNVLSPIFYPNNI